MAIPTHMKGVPPKRNWRMVAGIDEDGEAKELTLEGANLRMVYKNGTSIIDVTLSLDTNIYASGEVLAATQEIANAVRIDGGTGVIQSLIVLDQDDLGLALDIVFLQSDVSIGSENATVSLSDANAVKVVGIVQIGAGDYVDLVGSQLVTKTNLSILAQADTSSTSLYVAAISRAAGTYTAAGITLKIGILRD